MHRNQLRDSRKNREIKALWQIKVQDKTSEKDLNKMKISDFPDKVSK